MNKVELDFETIYGEVVAKANNYEAVPDGKGGKRIIKGKIVRDYERYFLKQLKKYRGKNIDVPFELYCKIYYKTMRKDLDNSLKTLLDCLQYGQAITDDNLCVMIKATKHIDHYRPRVEFALHPIQQSLFDA